MGKPAIIAVLGYSVIFMMVGLNLNNIGTRSAENYFEYYERSAAHSIAICGANLAANQIFVDATWRAGYGETGFARGVFSVVVDSLPGGLVKVTSTGKYLNVKQTITFILQPSTFSKFAYFTNIEGAIYWVSTDTVWGPFHTNSKMNISGSPVFYGKVTAKLGTNPIKSAAKFYGGYQSGVQVNLPNDMSKLIAAASSGKKFDDQNVWLTFNANGTVTWKTSAKGPVNKSTVEPAGPGTTEPLSTFAPNGVILANNGNMVIKGTVNGKATVSATGSSGLGLGNVHLDNDVVYAQDPRTGPSDDVLGIAVDNNVIIRNNAANNSNIRVQASIFSRSGGFTAEDYSTRPVSGKIELLGGLIMYQRGAVGTFTGSPPVIKSGFSKRYRYDDRFLLPGYSPPSFPTTNQFEIISWLE